ncbi:hypothetical protein EG68_10416 [Paragonimus skrjabini miyazakii]|uniref:CWH43-like N-terminal domain-containing protein n=1 Tax=Paragonimus skrjabini miyazakii TaxID=59628 RepID=A0A8S9YFK7_9TREM|nr:hypothetical protein EG68_10416 [Paragonimus skrjabini miyazakii]
MGGGTLVQPADCLYPRPSIIKIPLKTVVIVGTSLPFSGVVICTIISLYTAFDEVTESVCGVSNFVPSISAVTGITPQLYFWRYAIGFHSAPRLLLAMVYYNYHRLFLTRLSCPMAFDILIKLALFFNLVDVITFVGVAFVSNRENFPVHERMFIVFLFASSLYMLTVLIIHRILNAHYLLPGRMQYSFTLKRTFFLLTMFFISVLIYYFYYHRFKCFPNGK